MDAAFQPTADVSAQGVRCSQTLERKRLAADDEDQEYSEQNHGQSLCNARSDSIFETGAHHAVAFQSAFLRHARRSRACPATSRSVVKHPQIASAPILEAVSDPT